jgi:hypothetical protein
MSTNSAIYYLEASVSDGTTTASVSNVNGNTLKIIISQMKND